MLFAGTVVAEQCGFFHNRPRTPTVGAWEGSSSANSHKSQHPAEFFHIRLFKPSVQAASSLPPGLASLLMLTSNAQIFWFAKLRVVIPLGGKSLLWFLRACALHKQDLCLPSACLTDIRGTPKVVPPFSTKQIWEEWALGGPSLTLSCLSRVTIPPLPWLPVPHSVCALVHLCLCAVLASPFSETPRYLSDLGRFSFSSTNGRSLTLIKFVQWDLVLLNKWMGVIFPSNPIEIHFILQFPWKEHFEGF